MKIYFINNIIKIFIFYEDKQIYKNSLSKKMISIIGQN